MAPVERASLALGALRPGDSVSMITKGQFSMLDLLMAVIEQTGPAHVVISTWTMGIRDAERAEDLLRRRSILSLRMLVDRSFPTRQPKYAAQVLARFGPDAFVLSRVHAKFAVVLGADLSVCVRGSMNLNTNPRWEQADVDVDAGLCAFYAGLVTDLGGVVPAGLDATEAAVQAGLDRCGDSSLRIAPPVNAVPVDAAQSMGAMALAHAPLARTDYWTDTLGEITSYIAGAVEDRSWTAVAQLTAKRNEIMRELEARAAVAASDAFADADEAALEIALVDALCALPEQQRASVLARFGGVH